jgi:hypothetical protein
MVFATMSFFAARFGVTLSSASAISRPALRPGRSRKNACDRRRSPRRPASGAATGDSRSSLPSAPLISALTRPSRALGRPQARGPRLVRRVDDREARDVETRAVRDVADARLGTDELGREVPGERAAQRKLQRIGIAGVDDSRRQRRLPDADAFDELLQIRTRNHAVSVARRRRYVKSDRWMGGMPPCAARERVAVIAVFAKRS